MATVLITGGTGMIGKAITKKLLDKGHNVIILTRRKPAQQHQPHLSYAEWDIENQQLDPDAIKKSDYIIHLAGAGVADKRWTKKRKKEIVDSRVKSAALLIKSLRDNPNNVKSIIGISGIGYYGPDPVIPNPKPFVETDPPNNDFLGNTCQQWEAGIDAASGLGKRVVKFRTGIVFSEKGGALEEFKRPLKFGVATILGDGKQIVSWIHVDDLVQLFVTAIQNENITGTYNAVSPGPVTNRDLITAIAKARNKYFISFAVPSFLLKIALGELSIEVLKSATVSSNKIQQTGFRFQYPDIASCTNLFQA